MFRSPLCPAILLTCLASGGCGTVCNLASPGQRAPFGGIRNDLDVLDGLCGSADLPALGNAGFLGTALAITPLLDLPLSAVGDTLTLPVVRWMGRRRAVLSPAAGR